jgi:hypothetical protein
MTKHGGMGTQNAIKIGSHCTRCGTTATRAQNILRQKGRRYDRLRTDDFVRGFQHHFKGRLLQVARAFTMMSECPPGGHAARVGMVAAVEVPAETRPHAASPVPTALPWKGLLLAMSGQRRQLPLASRWWRHWSTRAGTAFGHCLTLLQGGVPQQKFDRRLLYPGPALSDQVLCTMEMS